MAKKNNNSKKMPIHIPNQSLFDNGHWAFPNRDTMKQHDREYEFQKKLALRKK